MLRLNDISKKKDHDSWFLIQIHFISLDLAEYGFGSNFKSGYGYKSHFQTKTHCQRAFFFCHHKLQNI